MENIHYEVQLIFEKEYFSKRIYIDIIQSQCDPDHIG